MAMTLGLQTESPTMDFVTEVIVGPHRHVRTVSLEGAPRWGLPDSWQDDTHLLVAINPRVGLDELSEPGVRHGVLDGDDFYFRLPSWMDVQARAEDWRSQSVSGALYLSRTDLCDRFDVPCVLLLQVLRAGPSAPCYTSYHSHDLTREVFEPLDGAGLCEFRNGGDAWHRLDDRLDVPPRTAHQLRRMSPGCSVNLIQMFGPVRIQNGASGNLLDMRDHIYRKPR
jgi:hypothetical protein